MQGNVTKVKVQGKYWVTLPEAVLHELRSKNMLLRVFKRNQKLGPSFDVTVVLGRGHQGLGRYMLKATNDHVVRFLDGDRFNHHPENIVLEYR